MPQRDPTAIANKWSTNLSNSTATVQAGVNAVTTAPGQAAAAAQATMRARVLAAIDSGKWAANVSAVTLQQWKTAMINTGIPRLADGANKGKPKMQAFMSAWLPFVSQVQAQIRQMPNATPQDRINRMVQNVQLLSQFRKPPGS